jgi:glycosyltransferase involved in cell wall biosynthesis
MRTVLIFAHECAPYHRPQSTVAAQRPAQFAKHLPEFGWRAVVVCADAARRGAGCDEESVAREAREAVAAAPPGASVVVPTPSLPWDGLVDRWWRAAADGGRGKALARKVLTVAKFPRGDYSSAWQPCARVAARAVAETVAVDACIGAHSPDAGLFLARWFSAEYGVPWVADFRDPILQPLHRAARAVYRPIARRLVSTAACTVNVTEVWSELDRELFGAPAHTIPNGFDPEEFAGLGDPRPGRFEVAYMGRVDALQRIDVFLDGLRLARERSGGELDVTFVYRGYGAGAVARLAERAGVAAMVDVGAHTDRPRALALMRGAHVLLLLSIEGEDEFYRRGFYPAKTFEYFGAGRPILCVPGDGGVLDALLRDTRTGVVCGTPEAVAEYLADAFGRWRRGGEIPYAPDEEAVSRFTRRALAGRLASVLDSVAAPR